MPGFYFDFHDGETAIDEEGANFASIDVLDKKPSSPLEMPCEIFRARDLAS